MISVSVIRRKQTNYPAAFRRLLDRFLPKAGQLVEGEAKLRTPVDTGRLRGSIASKVDGDKAIVGTNVEYAPYVEYGTGKMRAQPYLRPSIDYNRSNLRRLFEKMFREVFRGT
jgi:HK97 gp10 family phage protein